MALAPGTRLGPYEVLSPIGAGGMGEVYRGRDTRLGREIAIKVLPVAVASDEEHLHRFEREARSASALNHPNIVTIYDVGETDGVSWIAMELVEGESVRQMLSRGALSVRQVLSIGTQIAAGLAKAHASNIVHRDLKPENVMVTPEGLVKILDFGLAKTGPALSNASQAPTATAQTKAGVLLGTVGYMSPEQATGSAVDFRSDQFALGAILYEMASGRRAFQRPTSIETLSAILKEEPEPLSAVAPATTDALTWIVARCLSKKPEARYQSTEDLAQDLAGARERTGSIGLAATRRGPRRSMAIALVGVALAAIATLVVLRTRTGAVSPGTVRSLAVLPLRPFAGDSADEALGLGIADTIIRGLSRAGAILVRPLSAVRRYSKSDVDALTAAHQLDTDAVLEGSVQRAGDELRVSVNLLRASDGRSIWTESFDVPYSQVFQVEDQVSDAVVSRLRLHLEPAQRNRLKKRFTDNPEAYEAFVLGVSEEGKSGPGWGGEHIRTAVQDYERAVQLDPAYALAHARLAAACVWRDLFFDPGQGFLEKAKSEAAAADRLDPDLAETHMVRYQIAWSHYQGFDIEAALREAQAARRLDPLVGHNELTILYAHMGLTEAFRREVARSLQVDPTSQTTKRFSVEGLVLLAHFDEALALAKQLGTPFTESRLPMALLSTGRFDDARAATETLLKESPGQHVAVTMRELVAVVSHERPPDEAAIARALEKGKLLRDYHHTLYAVACIRAMQGNARAAVEMLRRTVAAGMPDRTLFRADPLLARIRGTPEFAAFDAELAPVSERYAREVAEGEGAAVEAPGI
jgi:eukaryotic-like serine/threonine-protein kinase